MSYFESLRKPEPTRSTQPTALRPDAEGIHPYARAIRDAWCERLTRLQAKPWHHGDAWDNNCFVAARKLIELANSPWSGYTIAQAQSDYAAAAPYNSSWDGRQKCWNQARDYAGGDSLPEPEPGQPIPAVTILDLDNEVETSFWAARPVLRHIHTFARARMVSPWAVLLCTLARISTATPYTVHLPPIIGSKASLNLFIVLVGHSGDGKGAAEGVSREAVLINDEPHPARLASGEAIAHVLKHRVPAKEGGGVDWNRDDHAAYISVPEIDRLTAQGQRQGSTLMADLRSAWSGEILGQMAADITRSIPIEPHAYRLAMSIGMQPHRSEALLGDADGGTPQRMVFGPANDPEAPDEVPDAPTPIEWELPPRTDLHVVGGKAIDVCDAARKLIITERRKRLRGDGDALDGHLLLTRLKVAALLGVLDGRWEASDQDWDLAGDIIKKSQAVIANVQITLEARRRERAHSSGIAAAEQKLLIEETVEDRRLSRVAKRLMTKLAAEGEWVGSAVLRRHMAYRDRQVDNLFEEAIDHLLQGGQIEVDERGENTFYLAIGEAK